MDGKIFHMPYHQKRYESVLKALGIQEVQNLQELIEPPKYGLYKCRLVYTPHAKSSSAVITTSFHEYKKREISSLKLIFNNNVDYVFKSTNREALDTLYAQRGEGDDVLLIKNLLVTDTTIANIAFYRNGMWTTPKEPLLKGTTRARLLEEGQIVEAEIKVNELRTFSKVALLNAMIDFDVLEKCDFLI